MKIFYEESQRQYQSVAINSKLAEGGEMAVEKYDIETGAAILTFEVVYDTNKWSM